MKKFILWINIIGMIILSSIQLSCKKDTIENEYDITDLDQYYIVGIIHKNKGGDKFLYSIYFTKEGDELFANYVDNSFIKKARVQYINDTLRIKMNDNFTQIFNYSLKKQANKYVLKFLNFSSDTYSNVQDSDTYLFRKDNALSYQGHMYESVYLDIHDLYSYVKLENLKWGATGDKNIVLNKNYTAITNYIWQGENHFGVLVPEWEEIKHPVMLMTDPGDVIYKFKKID